MARRESLKTSARKRDGSIAGASLTGTAARVTPPRAAYS
jgi:hypothetical protein